MRRSRVTTRELGTWNGGTKAREDRGPSTAVILNRGWGVGGSTRGGAGTAPRWPIRTSEGSSSDLLTNSNNNATQKMVLIGYWGAMHPG